MNLDKDPPLIIRPRFLISTDLSIEELEELLKRAIKRQTHPCYGSVSYGYAVIKISKKLQHFWSPQLSISMEQEGSKTTVRGLYGPKPSVWTMFIFFYSIIGFSTLIVLMVGLTRYSLDKPIEIIWLVPVGLLLIVGIYFGSAAVKKIGKEQLQILHHFFESATNLKVDDVLD